MPGVPSSRGCEGCRAQKKKCDQKRPSCSRCSRLNLDCVGAGQQRFKFKMQHAGPKYTLQAKERMIVVSSRSISPTLSNQSISLSLAFTEMIKPSTDIKYNLAWSYGDFLHDVPQRIGINEALDSAATALVDAHSYFCVTGTVSPTARALMKYSDALVKLRLCLDDPAKAQASETLCAVMLLMICQGFNGVTEGRWTGHCEGAAQILKARRFYNPKDAFESKLVMTLRGPILFEGLMNEKIQLSTSEWRTLVDSHLDGQNAGGLVMRSLVKVPEFRARGRRVLAGQAEDATLLEEMRNNYTSMKDLIREQLLLLAKVEAKMGDAALRSPLVIQAHSHLQRMSGISLVVGIILNCVLSAIDPDKTTLSVDSAYFSGELWRISQEATVYRPLGSSYVPLLLVAAWIGSTDMVTRAVVEEAFVKYHPGRENEERAAAGIPMLEEVGRFMRLEE